MTKFRSPTVPTLTPIELIHRPGETRDSDHGVTFARRVGFLGEDRWEDLFTIPAQDLKGWFPQLVDEFFGEDSFFTVNGFLPLRDKKGVQRPSDVRPELARPNHRAHLARYLCACYADLDFYKMPGLDFGRVIGELVSLQDKGVLPVASMFTRSGRGMWAFWFVRELDSNAPVRAWPNKVALYEKVQRAINNRLRSLGADAKALDVSRFTRIAGSVHSDTKRHVQYLVSYDANQRPYLYTLDQLADAFGVARPQALHASRSLTERDPKKSRDSLRGSLGRWAKELERFEKLRDLRGEFRKGCRTRALRLYAGMLVRVRKSALRYLEQGGELGEDLRRFSELTDHDIYRAVRQLVAACELIADDKVRNSDADSAVRTALTEGGVRTMSAQSIADALRVTHEEAAQLDWPCASEFGAIEKPPQPPSREEQRVMRERLILQRIEASGEVPPLRELRAWLGDANLHATTRTLMKDLARLGIENPRGRDARASERERAETPLFRAAEPQPEPSGTSEAPKAVSIAVEPAPPEQPPSAAAAPMSDDEWRRRALERFFRGAVPAGTGSEPGPEPSGTNEAHKAGPEAIGG